MSANPLPETSLAVFLEQGREILRTVGVGDLIHQARDLAVIDDVSFGNAGTLRSALKGARNAAEARFDLLKKPLNALTTEIRQMEKDVVGPIDLTVSLLDGKSTAYRQEQIRLADEKRRADEEAARKAEEERRLREAEATVAAGMSQDEALAILDEPVVVVLSPVVPVVPKVAGQSYVQTYSAEVFDLGLLQRHVAAHPEDGNLTIANMPALNQRAKAGGGRLSIPGVRVVAKETVRGRAAS